MYLPYYGVQNLKFNTMNPHMQLPHLESSLAMQFSELAKPLNLCETSFEVLKLIQVLVPERYPVKQRWQCQAKLHRWIVGAFHFLLVVAILQ